LARQTHTSASFFFLCIHSTVPFTQVSIRAIMTLLFYSPMVHSFDNYVLTLKAMAQDCWKTNNLRKGCDKAQTPSRILL